MKKVTTSAKNLIGVALAVGLIFVIQAVSVALGQRGIQKNEADSPSGVCNLMWQAVANMPQDLYGAAGASNGTFAYFAGGYSFTSGQSLTSLYRYDPVANTWTTLAPVPGPGFIMASAAYYPTTNKIYVFGGEDAVSGTNYNTTRIYDIASNTWTTGANMPDVRSFMGSGYNSGNGKIYLVSGYNTGNVDSAQPDTWEYDPVANTFTSKAPFPHPAGGFAQGVIAGHLYLAGGRDAANTIINLTWDYNIAANTWTAKANEPGSNNNVPGSAVAMNRLWVYGGGSPFVAGDRPSTIAAFIKPTGKLGPNGKMEVPATTNSTLLYDPATNSWTTTTINMTSLRAFPGSAAINNKLVAAGGFNGTTTVATAETLDATCIPTPTPTPCPGNQYTIAAGTAPIVPGTADSGNHCDDCETAIPLPFSFRLYNQTYTSVNADSNGRLDFVTINEPGGYITSCLPAAPNVGPYDYVIFGLWHDMRTDTGLSGCSNYASGCGVFTSTSGVAPNRIFNIEWRAVRFDDNNQTVNFEVRLYENSNVRRFDIIYGSVNGVVAADVGGVQGDGTAGLFTQDFCNAPAPQNVSRTYTSPGCAPTLNSVVSRKTHGAAGNFDIALPLTGTPGIECRTGGATNDYTIVVTFAAPVTVTGTPQAQVTVGAGCVGSAGACNGGTVSVSGAVVTIPLTNITDDQTINVQLNGVSDGVTTGNLTIPMTRNAGDTSGNGTVNSSDVAQTKGRIGQAVNATNFRSDVNANAAINSTDVTIIKQNIP